MGKTKNSIRNVTFGFILKLFQIIIPFIIRTIIIYFLGMEYAGLNSLFTAIFQVLNIAELGVGYALVVSMYKPIYEKDNKKICALMNLYRSYYRIIGVIILLSGSILIPFVPNLINGNVPNNINIYFIYLLNLGFTVVTYWLFAYKNSLFIAHQRTDIISKITMITDFFKYSTQIIILIFFRSYYLYLITLLFFQILNNLITAIVSKRKYPLLVPKGSLDNKEKKILNRQILDLFSSKIGMVMTNSVDSIVISSFLGLTLLGIYQNYFLIVSSIIAVFTIIYQSTRAAIGTNLLIKNMHDNYRQFKFFSFIIFGILCFSVTCLTTLFQTFMEIWVGKANMLGFICVLLFAIYLIVYEIAALVGSYKDASGKWHIDRFRPLVTAFVNLGINIILVNTIGITGILLSTIISYLFINIPWLFKRVFIDIFDNIYKRDYFLFVLFNLLIIAVSTTISYLICSLFTFSNLYLQFFVYLLVCTSVSFITFILSNLKNGYIKKIFYTVKLRLYTRK